MERSHRLAEPLFSAIEYELSEQTARRPSGASETPAGRRSFQSSSTESFSLSGLSG
jgi:hypothetical protein